jgi:hypothetical protein
MNMAQNRANDEHSRGSAPGTNRKHRRNARLPASCAQQQIDPGNVAFAAVTAGRFALCLREKSLPGNQ